MEKHERLKLARKNAGYKSAAEAARRLGIPYGTYSGHESGFRGIKDAELDRYADAFRVPLSWLAFGQAGPDVAYQTVSVIGVVGHKPNGIVEYADSAKHDFIPFEIQRPMISTASTAALLVIGDYIRGIAPKGSYIYTEVGHHPASYDGALCVCHLEDGTHVLKYVHYVSVESKQHSSLPDLDNYYCDLESITDPLMRSVPVSLASPVTLIALGYGAKVLNEHARLRSVETHQHLRESYPERAEVMAKVIEQIEEAEDADRHKGKREG